MTKNIFILLILIITAKASNSQINSTYLKEHAIPISKFDSLSSQIYEQINHYQLIMLGEIHGTNEPVIMSLNPCHQFTQVWRMTNIYFSIPKIQMNLIMEFFS